MPNEYNSASHHDPALALAKNAKVNINLEGWPAATTCSVGILGLATIVIVALVKG